MGTSRLQPLSSLPESPSGRLDSWKEIAAYLKRDERTVRRWEGEGLPVHRKLHKKQASVYAYRTEIDAWWRKGREPLEPAEHEPKHLISWALAVLAIVGLAILSLAILRNRWRGDRATSQAIHSLAVLPLEN